MGWNSSVPSGWRPRQESNLHLALRRRSFYPLNYGGVGRHSRAVDLIARGDCHWRGEQGPLRDCSCSVRKS